MKFIADGMLGRLTRWLRLLGNDVKYLQNAPDDELLAVAKRDGRTLLTCDLELHRRAEKSGINSFLIREEDEIKKLAELAKKFGIKLEVEMPLSRCPLCNHQIRHVEKARVVGRVNPRTLNAYDEYWECAGCGNIYWRGSHWKKIDETLKKARSLLKRG